MFLSKLILNVRDRLARRDLASPYEMHRTILSIGFDGLPKDALGRVLFRTDEDRAGRAPPVVLVQSDQEPDWKRLPTGYTASEPACKPFDPQFHVGQRLRFRLRANPTKRVAAKNAVLGPELAGKRIGLLTEPDQIRWILQKSEAGGFRLAGRWEDRDGNRIPRIQDRHVNERLMRHRHRPHRSALGAAVGLNGGRQALHSVESGSRPTR